MDLPENYIPYDGLGCPVEPNQYVDLIIRTKEGLGHSGIMQARLHDWTQNQIDGIGHVVAYRLSQRGEQLPPEHLLRRWAE